MAKTKQEKLDLKAEKLYYKTHKKKTKYTVLFIFFLTKIKSIDIMDTVNRLLSKKRFINSFFKEKPTWKSAKASQ